MIRVEGAEKRYGRFQAVYPLNLHVHRGEVFGFLGPNGAGKTTTIRMLAGVLSPTRGRIVIDGIDLARDPIESKRRVGYIPDRPYLYEKLTAREFLGFIARMYGVDEIEGRKRAEALLAQHDLLDRADELIEAWSHGMKQRLVLSAALLHEPRLLIVDEPMVGLDPRGCRQVKDTFRALAKQGRTVFLSTHSLDVAQDVCDRVGILRKGRLIALGRVDELLVGTGSHDLEDVFLQLTLEDEATTEARPAEIG